MRTEADTVFLLRASAHCKVPSQGDLASEFGERDPRVRGRDSERLETRARERLERGRTMRSGRSIGSRKSIGEYA